MTMRSIAKGAAGVAVQAVAGWAAMGAVLVVLSLGLAGIGWIAQSPVGHAIGFGWNVLVLLWVLALVLAGVGFAIGGIKRGVLEVRRGGLAVVGNWALWALLYVSGFTALICACAVAAVVFVHAWLALVIGLPAAFIAYVLDKSRPGR